MTDKKKRPDGAASTKGRGLKFNKSLQKGLDRELRSFKKDNPGLKVTQGMLKKVFSRGLGAYNDGHANDKHENGFEYAWYRVRQFLKVASGKKPDNKYSGDEDLLPKKESLVMKKLSQKIQESVNVDSVASKIRKLNLHADVSFEFAGDNRYAGDRAREQRNSRAGHLYRAAADYLQYYHETGGSVNLTLDMVDVRNAKKAFNPDHDYMSKYHKLEGKEAAILWLKNKPSEIDKV